MKDESCGIAGGSVYCFHDRSLARPTTHAWGASYYKCESAGFRALLLDNKRSTFICTTETPKKGWQKRGGWAGLITSGVSDRSASKLIIFYLGAWDVRTKKFNTWVLEHLCCQNTVIMPKTSIICKVIRSRMKIQKTWSSIIILKYVY